MWQEYVNNYRLLGEVMPISQVQNKLPKLRRYRVVLIDESHNLRNREGKRYRAITEYIAANESKCILLSATPYNKSYLDLSAQLRLFVPEDQDLGLRDNYKKILDEKNKSVDLYKKHAFLPKALPDTDTPQDTRLIHIRKNIEQLNKKSQEKLNLLLLDEFSKRLGIKYEEVQLTGKSQKRVLKVEDIAALKPFHWGYHFDKVLERGGFDAIITNPPWEIFKPQAKEFFAQHNELVTKNKMDIKDFEKEQSKLLQNPIIASTWLEYQSQYLYVSAYYRSSEQYKNQISIVNGKKAGTDINLYKLFTEQCFNLLRSGGECGIVTPSGIYTDLGTKQLREMLFSQTKVTGLFCLENRKEIFEGVHRSFKIVVITFVKGSITTEFPSAFMRHDVQELQRFPGDNSLQINVDMVRKLSPDSLSVMEFKNEVDICISEKMAKFPALSENLEHWNLSFAREFDMTNASHLFIKQSDDNLFALVQGNMFHQFKYNFAFPKYWIDANEGRAKLLGRAKDEGQKLAYQDYRIVHRRIARNTDERSLIACVLPPNRFCADTAQSVKNLLPYDITLFITAIFNSFVLDSEIRRRITAHCDMHFMYALRVPRLTKNDRNFNDIVQRAAKLICTTPEFDELAQEVGLGCHQQGVTEEAERAKLRAELDGIVAHLYGLTEDEFSYILTTFPIVNASVKEAALEAYRNFAPMFGESKRVALTH